MALTIFKDRYKNTDAATVKDKIFYLIIGATLFFGFAVNLIEVWVLPGIIAEINPPAFIVGYTVLLVAGLLINVISRNPIVSFIGYCMVVLPIGAVLSVTLPAYAVNTVRSAALATVLVSTAMVLLAIVYPEIFNSVFKLLLVCFVVAVIWSFISMLANLGASIKYVWIDWLIVLCFCCYIGFDVSFARNRPKTIDNAIDSACGLYLDIINVFIRLIVILFAFSRK